MYYQPQPNFQPQPQPPQQKTLRISPRKGYLTRKLDIFSENDAYIKLSMGDQQFTTETIMNQEIPEWDDSFKFVQRDGKNIVKFQVFDKDQLLDQAIGDGELDLKPYFQSGRAEQVFVKLKYDNKPAGKVLVDIEPVIEVNAYGQKLSRAQKKQIRSQIKSKMPTLSNDKIKLYEPSKHHRYRIDLQQRPPPERVAGRGEGREEGKRIIQEREFPPYGDMRYLHVPKFRDIGHDEDVGNQPPAYVGYTAEGRRAVQSAYPNPTVQCSSFEISNPHTIRTYLLTRPPPKKIPPPLYVPFSMQQQQPQPQYQYQPQYQPQQQYQSPPAPQQRSQLLLHTPTHQHNSSAPISRSAIKIGGGSGYNSRLQTSSSPYHHYVGSTPSREYYAPVQSQQQQQQGQRQHVVYVPRVDNNVQMHYSPYYVH